MSEYILAFHGGKKLESPEDGARMMERWNAWMAELGDALTNPGTPVGMSKTVSASGVADNGGPDPLMGYSIVQADSLEQALGMAKACPHIDVMQGTIEVAELKQM